MFLKNVGIQAEDYGAQPPTELWKPHTISRCSVGNSLTSSDIFIRATLVHDPKDVLCTTKISTRNFLSPKLKWSKQAGIISPVIHNNCVLICLPLIKMMHARCVLNKDTCVYVTEEKREVMFLIFLSPVKAKQRRKLSFGWLLMFPSRPISIVGNWRWSEDNFRKVESNCMLHF